MIPSQPSTLTYRPSPPAIQPESPIRGFLSPIPMNHSSPYSTRRSVARPSPQASFHSNGASPMRSPRQRTPVPSFSLHHSSPVNNLPPHASPVASPIPRRRTRSRRQSPPAGGGNKSSQSLAYTTHTQEVVDTVLPHSPLMDIPTPFKSSRGKKATKAVKKKKNTQKICVYHPPKTKRSNPSAAKKAQAAPAKRQTKANRAEQSQSKGNKSPKFVPVKVEGGEMINLQVCICTYTYHGTCL